MGRPVWMSHIAKPRELAKITLVLSGLKAGGPKSAFGTLRTGLPVARSHTVPPSARSGEGGGLRSARGPLAAGETGVQATGQDHHWNEGGSFHGSLPDSAGAAL